MNAVSLKFTRRIIILEVPGMELSDKRITKFLYIAEGVGVVFVALFIAAYLGGLPTTNVLHSELAFRVPLAIFGAVLVFLVAVPALVIAAMVRKD